MLLLVANFYLVEKKSQIIDSYNSNGFIAITSFFDDQESAEIEFELSRFLEEIMPCLESSEIYYEDKFYL